MNAKQYLSQVRKLDRMIQNKLSEIESLRGLAESITSTWKEDVVQTSGTSDKVGDCVSKIVDLQREINADIDRFIDLKREIMSVVDKLDSPYYDLIYKRYFQFKKWEEIAIEMNFTYQWVCKLHGKALNMVKNLMS